MEEIKLLESIKSRLGVIVSLLLQERSENSKNFSLRSQIVLLYNFGLRPKEIAEIIATSENYVNKEVSGIRKAEKIKNAKKK